MRMNRSFGKLTDGVITYAPNVINGETGLITRPTDADYLANGWKCVNSAPPATPVRDGYHYEADGWEERDGAIWRVWREVEDAVVYRRFSKLKIYGAIAQLGAWDAVKSWLEGKTVGGVNGWMAFELAQELSEEHPMFAALADEARQLLGLTSEQFEALLANCILEG